MSILLTQSGSLEPSEKICLLIETLYSPDATKRQSTRKALVVLDKAAVKPLIVLLSDVRPHVRWEAAKALSKIGDPASAHALVEALEDEESNVRWLAAVGSIWLREAAHHICRELMREGSFRELVPLLKTLEHPDPEVSVPLAVYDVMRLLYSS